jgi:murein L,D-transpeptidase YcbB/YkuD
MKKFFLFSVVLIIVIIVSFKLSKDDEFVVSEDYYDTIRKITIHAIPEDILADKSDSIKSIYAAFGNHEIWVDAENREDLIVQIEKSKQEGLNPQDFNINKIFQLEVRLDSLTLDEKLAYDILLTQSYDKLCNQYYRGKLNPNDIYENWDLFDKPLSMANHLKAAISSKKVASSIKNLLPNHPIYTSLKEALILINKMPESNFDSLKKTIKLKYNDTSIEVKEIKKRLVYWKDLDENNANYSTIYDRSMFKAVKKFQARHGLLADGVIGYGTIKALNYNVETRRSQILANLERWRWFPRDFGEQYLLINLPDYSLRFIKNQDTLATHKIVCGKPKRMTPILDSKLSNFVFNPTWTVPPTIIKEDLSVEAAANRSYFTRNRILIYNAKNTIVSPSNWNPNKATSYRYVQNHGYNNSLGVVKFNFPNHHTVYLHDTNHRDYFDLSFRALSSGCVRVQNPVDLAKKILIKQDNERWANGNEIDTIIKKNKAPYYIKIKEPTYVHLLYWTSWLNASGFQFRDDMYDLDKKLYDKLRN